MSLRHLARRTAALLLLAGCGDDAAPPAAAATPVEQPPPPAVAPTAESGFGGTWYLFMPDLPWIALRLEVLTLPEGTRPTWSSFDWSGSHERDELAARSRPVLVKLEGDPRALVIDGPAPMVDEHGQPNGHRGSWHMELRAALDGPPRLVGRATHTDITTPEGVSVEMTREFRPWTRN